MIALGFSRSATSASCGPENEVFRNSACAPSFEQATTDSTNPRWLRAMIATLSPSLTPSSASAWASEFVRCWISRNVSWPSSSMSATSSG